MAPVDLSFYRYTDHRHVRSFPTRRSSDLGEGTLRLGWKPGPRFKFAASATERSRRYDHRHQFTAAGRELGGTSLQDRKSTRLNSSHQIISYAVFCLKKQINIRPAPSRHSR